LGFVEKAALLSSVKPKGLGFTSLGRSPGNRVRKKNQSPERARPLADKSIALSGLHVGAPLYPGRCPGLSNLSPSGSMDSRPGLFQQPRILRVSHPYGRIAAGQRLLPHWLGAVAFRSLPGVLQIGRLLAVLPLGLRGPLRLDVLPASSRRGAVMAAAPMPRPFRKSRRFIMGISFSVGAASDSASEVFCRPGAAKARAAAGPWRNARPQCILWARVWTTYQRV